MILPIVTGAKNKVLRAPSKPVGDFDKQLRKLVNNMKETLASTENGIGLAAPQVGENIQVFVISDEFKEEAEGHTVFVNPKLSNVARKKATLEEGCLSLPGKWAELDRPQKVTIKAQDERGKKFKIRGKGLLARLFLHEVDHLKGKLFIDHL